MRIIVSVQSKRGSVRGLVHYIAHSKIDPLKEPTTSRELFNEFTDSLDVRSANNSLKTDVSAKRPANERLHHLVISFRDEDYRRFGGDDATRKLAAKDIVRAAVARLEESLNADRFAWAAALHLNTANPHVHVALQKQYFTKGIERKELTKIPREALPHYEKAAQGEKQFVPGILMEAAIEKMDQIIARDRGQEHACLPGHDANEHLRDESDHTPKLLTRWLVEKDELDRSEKNVESLLKNGRNLRLPISDPATRKRRKVSLRDIERSGEGNALAECRKRGVSDPRERASIMRAGISSEMERYAAVVRQLHAILHSLTVREETNRMSLVESFKGTDKEVSRVRGLYRKRGHRLPAPALTKEEIDRLQESRLAQGDLRGFGYLERAREELEVLGKIGHRTQADLGKLSAEKAMGELRTRYLEKTLQEARAKRYVRNVTINGGSWSVFALEKDERLEEERRAFPRDLLSRIGLMSKEDGRALAALTRDRILEKLDAEDRLAQKEISFETKKAKLISSILDKSPAHSQTPSQTIVPEVDHVAEFESLSLKIKDPKLFDQSWRAQQELIEKAGLESRAGRRLAQADIFEKKKTEILAGRAMAREIIANIELDRSKERLRKFAETQRFHKFEIRDESGNPQFVALNDLEMHHGSFLNQVVDLLVEDRDVRQARKTVKNLIKERESDLTKDAKAASEIFTIAYRTADQFRSVKLFGLMRSSPYQPIFTPREIAMIESRLIQSNDRRETKQLGKIYQAALEKPAESLPKILRDFAVVDEPKKTSEAKEHDVPIRRPRDRGHDHENALTR